MFEIPGMRQLRELSICLNHAGDVNRGDTLEIRIGPCPRLVNTNCYSIVEGVNVRIVE